MRNVRFSRQDPVQIPAATLANDARAKTRVSDAYAVTRNSPRSGATTCLRNHLLFFITRHGLANFVHRLAGCETRAQATADGFAVPSQGPREADLRLRNRLVSITDHHNLARPDNMDNQASFTLRCSLGSGRSRDPIRRDEARSRRDPQSKEDCDGPRPRLSVERYGNLD